MLPEQLFIILHLPKRHELHNVSRGNPACCFANQPSFIPIQLLHIAKAVIANPDYDYADRDSSSFADKVYRFIHVVDCSVS